MSGVGSFAIDGEIGIIFINSPPVNALSVDVRKALFTGFERYLSDDAVKGIVVMCEGRTFFAGADITSFGRPPEEPILRTLLAKVEEGPKPVLAAIHGFALGGGYELALHCHYRIALPSVELGLPEVNLGLLPGAGGTQRLPRVVGPKLALDLITSGRRVSAEEAVELGMIDGLAREGHLREDAVAFLRQVIVEGRPLCRVRDRQEKVDPFKGDRQLFDDFRATHARSFRGFTAPENIIKAIEAAVELPFDEGMARESELFFELRGSPRSEALRHLFFAERQAAKIPDVPKDTPSRPIRSVGVIGAGTMGGGITMNFLNAGIPVTLVEMKQEALDHGIAVIGKNYERTAKKGRLTAEELEQRMELLTPALDLSALSDVDLIVEAVFEDIAVKKDIFGKLDKIAKPGAILASNTSYLDLDEIAAATGRPEDVVGLHFFSPANVMRLLEVVRGEKTSKEVIAAAMKLGKTIGKVAVLSRVCYGFIANRIMSKRGEQSYRLVLEGPSPEQIDKAIYDYGFAMGPFQMADLVGLDVIKSSERNLRGDFVAAGRLGQKNGKGFYDYDENRKISSSPEAARLITAFADYKQAKNKGKKTEEDIVARLLYPVVNEGAKLLEEGIALRASDIDIAAVLGYNWPAYMGGPMFWADTVGLPKVVEVLKALEAEHGAAFRPAKLLEEKAERGETFCE
ncbi:3-hydroxyacyl-CoA dehydrogenase [Sphingobium sp. SCG-1]|uniref:3-hydroxyacyl-CoA dehydrogenase NAD-binding domain-containing protein n=1 Tax=Sphingobium sp. SCG-1 TaxID=2072936 RepID=UPI000CD6B0B6|nr:3-hydroxyacyl-CoA dehydrogenase NAD-binding domain-containing protein [Sphingobium sp. SCG-1]AUW57139.1 3-hydroxyacyl-CoA dehydrogenase [Sphingobium sp. SCG-1]